jgi:hypothetical protein
MAIYSFLAVGCLHPIIRGPRMKDARSANGLQMENVSVTMPGESSLGQQA